MDLKPIPGTQTTYYNAFGTWQEIKEPTETPHRHKENMQLSTQIVTQAQHRTRDCNQTLSAQAEPTAFILICHLSVNAPCHYAGTHFA